MRFIILFVILPVVFCATIFDPYEKSTCAYHNRRDSIDEYLINDCPNICQVRGEWAIFCPESSCACDIFKAEKTTCTFEGEFGPVEHPKDKCERICKLKTIKPEFCRESSCVCPKPLT